MTSSAEPTAPAGDQPSIDVRSAGPVDLSRVEYVVVGFASSLLPELADFPPGSVLFVEEPDVATTRRAVARSAAVPAVAGLIHASSQDESGLDWARTMPRPVGVRAVLPGVEYGVVGAAALAECWGLPGAGVPAARILRDKAALRQAAATAGIPQPDWMLATGPDDVVTFRAAHGGECVLKPAGRQGSLGVQRLGPDDDAAAAWLATVGAREPRLRTARLDAAVRCLVESTLHGPEYSCEVLVRSGGVIFANVTGKQVLPGRHPVELGHVVPAPLDDGARDALGDATRSLVSAVGFGDGILHAEWILDAGRPHLVECAARMPGDEIDVLIDLSYGGHLLSDLLELLRGGRPERPERPSRAAALRCLAPPAGLVVAVEGVRQAERLAGVIRVDLGLEVGDWVGPLRSSLDRVGEVIAVGDTPDAALRLAAEAVAMISISTDATAQVPLASAGSEPEFGSA